LWRTSQPHHQARPVRERSMRDRAAFRRRRRSVRCYGKAYTDISHTLTFLSSQLTFLDISQFQTDISQSKTDISQSSAGTQQPPTFISNYPWKTYGDYSTSVDICISPARVPAHDHCRDLAEGAQRHHQLCEATAHRPAPQQDLRTIVRRTL
jgi:hypothetical protein